MNNTSNVYKSTLTVIYILYFTVRLIIYSSRHQRAIITQLFIYMKYATVHEQCNHLISLILLPRSQSHTQAVRPNLRLKAVSLERLSICLPYPNRPGLSPEYSAI